MVRPKVDMISLTLAMASDISCLAMRSASASSAAICFLIAMSLDIVFGDSCAS